MNVKSNKVFLIVLGLCAWLCGQTNLSSVAFSQWRQDNILFIVFDIRAAAGLDSLAYPAFITPQPEAWIDSFGRKERLLVVGNDSSGAQAKAAAVVQRGYPADSVFWSVDATITSAKFPLADSLPFTFFLKDSLLPQDLSAYQLRALQLSKRKYTAIDVRSASEVQSGLIPYTYNIDWNAGNFQNCAANFSKNQNFVLNCASGHRAGAARSYLISMGFDSTRIINFGTFSKWSVTGLPISFTPLPAGNGCAGVLENYSSVNTRSNALRYGFNRSSRVVWIDVSNVNLKMDIFLYDMKGREIKKISSHGNRLEISNLSLGTYLLKVNTAAHLLTLF